VGGCDSGDARRADRGGGAGRTGSRIGHIVVYEENHSFDNLYGTASSRQLPSRSVAENEHPGYTGGPGRDLVDLPAVDQSRCSKDTMVVVTYDEFGGAWDHVPPPGQDGTAGPHDQWGPSTRVPALVVSPGLRGDFVVDHNQYDTTSILATIEQRFGLQPLGTRDAQVASLAGGVRRKAPGGDGGGDQGGDR
jgi:phospholipase C